MAFTQSDFASELRNLQGKQVRIELYSGRVIDGFLQEVSSQNTHISLVDSLSPLSPTTHFIPISAIDLVVTTA